MRCAPRISQAPLHREISRLASMSAARAAWRRARAFRAAPSGFAPLAEEPPDGVSCRLSFSRSPFARTLHGDFTAWRPLSLLPIPRKPPARASSSMRSLTHGVERVFCVPGESFLAVLDSLHDETEQIQTIVCRHEAARREHGRGGRQADRPPGRRDRHARAGRDARVDRRAHRVPGLDADDPADRPVRARAHGPRGVPGNRLSAHVRADGEVGRADRRSAPRARIPEPCVSHGDVRAARARSCSRCPKTC